jgi:cation:H+ antiporter
VLGSNLFNSLAAGGLIAVIAPGTLSDPDLTGLAVIAMVGSALVAWLFLTTGGRLTRWEAAVLLAAYLAMLPLLLR